MMILPFISRSFRRRFLRPRPLFLALTLFILFDAFNISSSIPDPVRTTREDFSVLPAQKIYIASTFRNTEYMLRISWNAALLNLILVLGPSNVFVSIVESGSQDDTKGALMDLKAELDKLGVGNRIDLGTDVYGQAAELLAVPKEGEDRTGWAFTGRGETGWEVRRIPYLARLRNKAMEPLWGLSEERRFDRVLWINDVIFTVCSLIISSFNLYHCNLLSESFM
jgi:hypothetical protein